MKEKIRIKQTDASRILLTEVLPYETPIIFSNKTLYKFAQLHKFNFSSLPSFVRRIFPSTPSKQTIPYDYNIRQGRDRQRKLSLIHPSHQLFFPEFYRKYDDLIVSLCQRSAYSLRYPVRLASYFYTSELDDVAEIQSNEVDAAPDEDGRENRYASSYFYYSKFNQLYKFVDSSEFLAIERQFSYLKRFDIKRCFASIYTHTISWAVKNKVFAKENRGISFDSEFDALMMVANYNETNGIVVGPEVSRIFAEIILQKIDLEVERQIEKIDISKAEYTIRRYLDDYFLFTRNKDVEKKIYEIVEYELEKFKLYINESKTLELTVPFATTQTIAKSDIQSILNDTLLLWLSDIRKRVSSGVAEENPLGTVSYKLKTPYLSASKIIRDIKISLKRSDESFNIVTGYALSAIIKSLYRLHKKIAEHGCKDNVHTELQNLITATMEIVFYLYSMDFRVRTTYLVAQFMLIANKFGSLDKRLQQDIQTRMYNLVLQLLNSRSNDDLGGIEIQNLLVALRVICPTEDLPPEDLSRYLCLREKTTNLTMKYFDFVSCLYYIRNNPLYTNIKKQVEVALLKRFSESDNRVVQDCEITMLLIDMLACPYIDNALKGELLDKYANKGFGLTLSNPDKNQIRNFFSSKCNFIDWSDDLELERILVRKQLSPGY